MPGFLGRQIIFEWGGIQIPGVREKGVAMNGEAVNVTSDEDGGWQKLLEVAGENSVELSLGGVTKNEQLKQDWFAGDRTKSVEITYPDGGQITGTFFMANYTDTGPYNDATTFEATLQSTGQVTYTPYS